MIVIPEPELVPFRIDRRVPPLIASGVRGPRGRIVTPRAVADGKHRHVSLQLRRRIMELHVPEVPPKRKLVILNVVLSIVLSEFGARGPLVPLHVVRVHKLVPEMLLLRTRAPVLPVRL